MKRNIAYIAFLVLAVSSCHGIADFPELRPLEEIVIGLGSNVGVDVINETKATAITEIPSTLYWGASTGTLNTGETAKWAAASASVSSSKINTGKYQTASPTTYNLFVSNQLFSTSSNKTTMTVANNNTDVIYGKVSSSSSSPSISLEHIFARTGSLTLNAPTGYTVTPTSWSIVGKSAINGTAGTFNLSSGSWTASSATLSSTSITGSSDYYLIPGTYTLTVTFTIAKTNGYSSSLTKSADITLVAGKINNITANVTSDPAVGITFTVSVSNWSSQNVAGNFQ